jgi:alpha-tubulin suppressor-like RCC1 family protein
VLTPAPVAGNLVFTGLTASGSHVCGLTSGGAAYCWGSNDTGEAGTGTFTQSVPTPTPVQTALRFTQISAEGVNAWSNSTCGLTGAGEAWCWGYNELGKLGDGTTTNSAVPVRVLGNVTFNYLHTGFFHSCATAMAHGELWCWGEQETDVGAFGAMPEGIYTTPVLVHPDFRFVQLSTGRNYTCGLDSGHSAFCWGANWFGSLGTEPATPETADPLPVAGGHSFVKLSAASFEGTQALTTDGLLYRWGSPGNDNVQATPVAMTELRLTQMDSGQDPFTGFTYSSCGISSTGSVYCVGTDEVVRGVPLPVQP